MIVEINLVMASFSEKAKINSTLFISWPRHSISLLNLLILFIVLCPFTIISVI